MAGGFRAIIEPATWSAASHSLVGVARQLFSEGSDQALERQIGGAARQRVVADVDKAVRLEMPVDEAEPGAPHLRANPRVDAVRNDVVESGQVKRGGTTEIRSMKMNVGNFGIAPQTPRVIHMRRHGVDAVKRAGWVRGRKDSGGDASAAAQVAPREGAIACRWFESGDERDVVEPRRRGLTNERPGVLNV